MFAKIQITGVIELVTGMHIGGSSAFAAIGAVDSPIIKDARTKLPMIPGSSFKGKLRSLLAKEYNEGPCGPDDDTECLVRLFGCAKKEHIKRSRVLISDMIMTNAQSLRDSGLDSITEIKFENSISRLTAVANPRQIERAVRGSLFDLDIIYEAENGKENEIVEDMEVLAKGLKLLQYDYLGGNGSRGYGKIRLSNLYAKTVIGEISEDILKKCNELLKDVMVQ